MDDDGMSHGGARAKSWRPYRFSAVYARGPALRPPIVYDRWTYAATPLLAASAYFGGARVGAWSSTPRESQWLVVTVVAADGAATVFAGPTAWFDASYVRQRDLNDFALSPDPMPVPRKPHAKRKRRA